MREGFIVQMGPALDLYRAPKDIFAARTFSDLNELPARVHGGRVETPLGTFAAEGFEDGTGVIACVRQGGIRLLEQGQGTPGRVLESRFLGDVGLLELAVDGVDGPILVRVREADMPACGTDLGVGVDESAVLLFAAPNG
jgi:iron(III) transport system ATP-binding protein